MKVFRYGKVSNRILARHKNQIGLVPILFLGCDGRMRTPTIFYKKVDKNTEVC